LKRPNILAVSAYFPLLIHKQGYTILPNQFGLNFERGNKMKKCILITLVSLVCLIVPSVLVIAKNTTVSENIAIFASFKMEILEDGKLTENKMLVELRIVNVEGDNNIYIDWNHVYIDPVHEFKTVILKAQHFSTLEGSIKNVIANNNSFSFVIDLSGTPLGAGRTVQVVGNKKLGQDGYSVEATALWWSEIINRKIKTEWRSTDKTFILPYKEVF